MIKAMEANSQQTELQAMDRTFKNCGLLVYERSKTGEILRFEPQGRYAKSSLFPLHKYGSGSFCKFKVPGLPPKSGVYVFCDGERVLYVGKAVHLQKRFSMGYGNISPKNCYVGGQQTNSRINQLVLAAESGGSAISLFVYECQDQDRFEAELIAHFRPEWNRQA